MSFFLKALGFAVAALAAMLLGSYLNGMFYTGVFAPNILIDALIAIILGLIVAFLSERKKQP